MTLNRAGTGVCVYMHVPLMLSHAVALLRIPQPQCPPKTESVFSSCGKDFPDCKANVFLSILPYLLVIERAGRGVCFDFLSAVG